MEILSPTDRIRIIMEFPKFFGKPEMFNPGGSTKDGRGFPGAIHSCGERDSIIPT